MNGLKFPAMDRPYHAWLWLPRGFLDFQFLKRSSCLMMQVMPGTDEEMSQFDQSADANSSLVVSISLPILKVHLPSKSFLELVYNRWAVFLLFPQQEVGERWEVINRIDQSTKQMQKFIECVRRLHEQVKGASGSDSVRKHLASNSRLYTCSARRDLKRGRVSVRKAGEKCRTSRSESKWRRGQEKMVRVHVKLNNTQMWMLCLVPGK